MDHMPEVGEVAPDFDLPHGEERIRLGDYRGRKVVLFFYPQAFTGGCTTEVCSLRDEHESIAAANAVILGVSIDDEETQQRFGREYGVPFPLLADQGGEVARSYGVFGITRPNASVLEQARRVTFIIDEQGRIARRIDSVTPDEHGREISQTLSELAAA
jgi:thioredoxin-dependent peroxiredoxin